MFNEQIRSTVTKTPVYVGKYPTAITDAGDIVGIHYHDELEFIAILEGKFECTAYGKKYVAEAGDVIFINSRVAHYTCALTPCKTGLIQLRESKWTETETDNIIRYSTRFRSQLSYPVVVFKEKELFSVFTELFEEVNKMERSYEIFVKSAVYRIMGTMYRKGVLSDAERIYNTREVQKILPALHLVNSSYAENLTLEQASEELGFDRSYFCRIFKLATGATFTEYLNFVRICKAEKLLQNSGSSILEISEAVGFSSVSYFNRIFKKYRNCSPRFYRTVVCSVM
jgi:AraC-like DNA-binding protein